MEKDLEIKNPIDKQKKDEPTITNVASYLQVINETLKDGVVLYRGHGNKDWKLKPSVGREKRLWENEKEIFLNFKQQYYMYADERPLTDIDILFLAQHFELPTRLLDWSYNPLVALWFACQHENVDGRVYIKVLNKEKYPLKEGHQLDFDIFDEENKIKTTHLFLVPDYTIRRYFNQKGMFIWCKDPSVIYDDCDKEFIISQKYKTEILKELFIMGITKAFILPSLENLCIDIKNKYK